MINMLVVKLGTRPSHFGVTTHFGQIILSDYRFMGLLEKRSVAVTEPKSERIELEGHDYLVTVTPVTDSEAMRHLGNLIEVAQVPDFKILRGFWPIALVLLVWALVFALFIGILKSVLVRPIRRIVDSMKQMSVDPLRAEFLKPEVSLPLELFDLVRSFSSLHNRFQEVHQEVKDKEATQAKLELAKRISHDIQPSMGAIRVALQQMNENAPERTLIREGLARLEALTRDLLSKDSSGESACIDSLAVAAYAVEEHRPSAEGMNVELDLNPVGWPLLMINPVGFYRILSNCIKNGIEASALNSGGGRVRVLCSISNSSVDVRICDSGPGIALELRSRIFVEGYSTKSNGTGIGLASSLDIAKSFRGRIDVEDFELENSFVLKIPIEHFKGMPVREFVLTGPVLCLDDDPSENDYWRRRLGSKNVETFSERSQFERALTFHPRSSTLVDFDLGDEVDTIEFLVRMGINSKSLLVTNRVLDAELYRRAQRVGLKVMPKNLRKFCSFRVGAEIGHP